MDSRKLIKDFAFAISAQGLNVVASVILTLVLPKVLGVEEFGYWQLFIFYAGYVGFFHLGINDGVYLLKGGESRAEIDKKGVNSQFWMSTSVQLVVSCIVMAFAVFGPFDERREFVVFMTGLLIVINNAGLYLGFVFQAMNETRLFSFSVVLESIALLVCLIVLIAMGVRSFEPYVACYIGTKVVRLVYCAWKARDFFGSGLSNPRRTFGLCVDSIRVGIKLMFANIVGSLILGVARFLVDLEWGVEVFSIVSFSLSITSFFMLFISQASMVLFPALRRIDDSGVSQFFVAVRDGLNAFLPAIYLLYLPIVYVLELWLPDYAASLALFSLVFPLCVFDGKMDVLGITYLKVLRKEKALLSINVVVLVCSTVVSLVSTYVFASVDLMLIAIVVILGVRELFSELLIERELSIRSKWMSFSSFALSLLFVALNYALGAPVAAGCFAAAYLVFLFVFRKSAIRSLRLLKASMGRK